MITQHRARTPIRTLLLAATATIGVMAIVPSAFAVSYYTPTGVTAPGGATTFAIGPQIFPTAVTDSDQYTLNITPVPGTLSLIGSANAGLQITSVTLSNGSSSTIAPVNDPITGQPTGLTWFWNISQALSTPLLLTIAYSGTGS